MIHSINLIKIFVRFITGCKYTFNTKKSPNYLVKYRDYNNKDRKGSLNSCLFKSITI